MSDITGAVGVAQTPEGLSAIRTPGCAAAIWDRAPLPEFQRWIDHIDPDALPHTRMILAPDAVRDALSETALICGTPNCPECGMLVDDIAALATIFADVMQTPYIRLRLDVIRHNACRKFHMDAVTARLICTYRGTGTQYGLSDGGHDPAQIFTVPACAPIILRGKDWPVTGSNLVHRSPPIEGSGETRLLLVIDPITDPGTQAETTLH
ncbi:MAG: DUF1826 domain-containing protein [Pseudomonadota bacterium]